MHSIFMLSFLLACSPSEIRFAPFGELLLFEDAALATLEWGLVEDGGVRGGELYGEKSYAPCAWATYEGIEEDHGCKECERHFKLELQFVEDDCGGALSSLLEVEQVRMGLSGGEESSWHVLESHGWEHWGRALPSDAGWILESDYSMAF